MRTIDLRSDTVTVPTPSMRKAMAEAQVGDDVFGEDPTINRLEEKAADRMGKEAALFVASGTMGNLVSILSHCVRGDEIIAGDKSHIFCYEQAGAAAVGGVQIRTIKNEPDGTIDLEDIKTAIRPDDVHHPPTRLIALENTHNGCSGSPLSSSYLKEVRKIADDHGLSIHMDGARIFNAAAALNTDVRDLAGFADSISFCLSKGLSAPVGSVVCGTKQFIKRARRARKVIGGGMRQAGILAAAGIVAIDEMAEGITYDHANAKKLAQGLSAIDWLAVDSELVRTNILFADITKSGADVETLCQRLEKEGIRILAAGPKRFRAVTHHPITEDDIDYAVSVFERIDIL